jgi:hypothetical protein
MIAEMGIDTAILKELPRGRSGGSPEPWGRRACARDSYRVKKRHTYRMLRSSWAMSRTVSETLG